jgi:ketosteroid isomerase-like protein
MSDRTSTDGSDRTAASPGQVVREFWERLQARDWEGALARLAPGVMVDWPATGERFESAEAVVGVNRAYPEGWQIRVVRVVEDGDTVATEVEVPQEGLGVFAVASFWTVHDGLIRSGREFWVMASGDDPPEWRSAYARRYDGRLE